MGLQGAWTAEVVSQKDQLRGPAATFMLRGPAARIHPESVFRCSKGSRRQASQGDQDQDASPG